MATDFDYGIHYREFHDDSDEHASAMANFVLSSIGKWLPQPSSSEVVDIGCGMGFAMSALKSLGFEKVFGVDVDRSQIEISRRKGLNVELIDDLGKYLVENPSRFGLITMVDVLEHIPTDGQIDILKKLHSALSPGGRLILQVPNASSIIAPRWQYIDFTHHTSYTEHSIRFAVRSAGFAKVHVPYDDNLEPRPSLHPGRIFSAGNRQQFKRWMVRRLWRQVMMVEMGERQAEKIPLGVNLLAIADKAP